MYAKAFGSSCGRVTDRGGSPLTGLGTSTSRVGAYVLAGELAATPDDHQAAFARYQREMRDYVAECQKLPPGGVRGFAPQSQLMISSRNVSTRLMTAWPARTLIAKQFRKADRISLTDYRRVGWFTERHDARGRSTEDHPRVLGDPGYEAAAATPRRARPGLRSTPPPAPGR